MEHDTRPDSGFWQAHEMISSFCATSVTVYLSRRFPRFAAAHILYNSTIRCEVILFCIIIDGSMAFRTQSSKYGSDLTIQEAVKELRARLGDSQQTFATNIGVSMTALNHYEKDWVPPLELLLRFREMARERHYDDLRTVFDREYQPKLQRLLKDTPVNHVGLDLEKAWGDLHITFTSRAEFNRAKEFLKEFNAWRDSDEGRGQIRASELEAQRKLLQLNEASEQTTRKKRKAS
jgi:DNA-binding XRE family transcriptional regulator